MFRKSFALLLFIIILHSILLNNVAFANGDINISTDTNWPEDDYSMNSLTVSNGATLSIDGGSTISVTGTLHISENSKIVLKGKNTSGQISGQWQGNGVTINAAHITIDTGSKISADGQGYVGGVGPGVGNPDTYMHAGSGGGYGGQGGNSGGSSQGGGIGGLTYGSSTMPTDLGSGGGSAGGSGGGSILLNVSGTLTLNGVISANGTSGANTSCGAGAGGGGSGGSIFINVGTLTGSGLFTANGGIGGSGGCTGTGDNGGGGGGGRIAVYYASEQSYDGFSTSSANGGTGANAGQSGTVAFINTTENHLQIFSQTFTYEENSSIAFNAITIDSGTLLTIGGGSVVNVTGTLAVTNSSTIVLKGKNTSGQVSGQWQGTGVTINAGNLIIDSGSKISSDGQGYVGGVGPGVGNPDNYMHAGSGGGYGGQGGNSGGSSQGGGIGGLTYGSSTMPIELGSGGGSAGGSGGGSIRLNVSGVLTLNGVISTHGTAGTNTPCGVGAGGGGSGGSILVTVGTLTGSGSFTANGGIGGVGGCYGSYSASDDGGGGGGGRIAIYYSNTISLPLGNITDNGGAGANAGYPGTIVIRVTPPESPSDLISIPNTWTHINSFSATWSNPTDPSGIVAAWYKIGSPPTSNDDGARVLGDDIQALNDLVVPAPAEGESPLYVWLEDVLGNRDYNHRAQTTLKFDGSPPVDGTIFVNNEAWTTTSLVVTLNNLGAIDLLSGFTQMRFSNNSGGPWSSDELFTPTKNNWDISYGGDTNPGYKTIYVQYGDAAGNWSQSFSSSIYYQPLQPFPFTDDFSTEKGWFGYESGAWERGSAKAGGGENGYLDPGTDYSDFNDNNILGFAIGEDYPNDLIEKSIISPPIDCTGKERVFLKFRRYLNVESNEYDHAKIYVSANGTDWNQVWENPPIDLMDSQWVPFVLDISSIAANQGAVYIKFTMGPTNFSRRFSGWNIDDLEVTSEAIYPSEGTYGTELDIWGSGFGSKKGKVFIDTTALTVSDWTDNFIKGTLKKVVSPVTYDVKVQPVGPKGTPSFVYEQAFVVRPPEIHSIEQGEGTAYDEITIKGKFFGTKKGKVYLEYEEEGQPVSKSCKVVSWEMNSTTNDNKIVNESKIVFVVPKMSPEVCDVVVDPYGTMLEIEEEDGFEVKDPEIESVNPIFGSVKQEITISGNYFGNKKPKVYLRYESKEKQIEKSCSILSWGDDKIVFVVPTLPNGSYDVIVKNVVGSAIYDQKFNIE